MLKSSNNTFQIKATKSILIFILLMMCGIFVFAQSNIMLCYQNKCFISKENSIFELVNKTNILQSKSK